MEEEIKKLKDIIISLNEKLKETEKSLAELKKNVDVTCEQVLSILRDGENYHHTDKK